MAYVKASIRRALTTRPRPASYVLLGDNGQEITTIFGPMKTWRGVWNMVNYYNSEKTKWHTLHPFDGNKTVRAIHVKSGELYYEFAMKKNGEWTGLEAVQG